VGVEEKCLKRDKKGLVKEILSRGDLNVKQTKEELVSGGRLLRLG
jgi:hypothetical protein